MISVNSINLPFSLYIIEGLFLLTSCHLVTKDDLAQFRRDIRDDIHEVRKEVQAEAKKQEQQTERQTELVLDVSNKVSEKRGLAAMIARRFPWSWFGAEFLLFGGFSFFASLRLNRIYLFRRAPVTTDEYESITVASWVLNKFLSRRRIESPKTDPDNPGPPEPPNDKPPLRIVGE